MNGFSDGWQAVESALPRPQPWLSAVYRSGQGRADTNLMAAGDFVDFPTDADVGPGQGTQFLHRMADRSARTV